MQGYFSLSYDNRRRLLLVLAKEFDLNRTQVRELIKQYLGGHFCAYCLLLLIYFNFSYVD